VWWVDFDPTRGREQAKDRAALVVSSAFHLQLTLGDLVTVLPMTTRQRPGWLHHIEAGSAASWVMTEQIRTVSIERFRRPSTDIVLSAEQLRDVRRALAQMLIV
jgi:mRNA interferase MazF